jgi:hypothetical protein
MFDFRDDTILTDSLIEARARSEDVYTFPIGESDIYRVTGKIARWRG